MGGQLGLEKQRVSIRLASREGLSRREPTRWELPSASGLYLPEPPRLPPLPRPRSVIRNAPGDAGHDPRSNLSETWSDFHPDSTFDTIY